MATETGDPWSDAARDVADNHDGGVAGEATDHGDSGAARIHEHDPAERARDAVDHLQAAARELIAAARAALDVADDLVNDRDATVAAAQRIASLGDLVRQVPRRQPWDASRGRRRGPGAPWPAAGEHRPGGEHRPAGERIERIEVR